MGCGRLPPVSSSLLWSHTRPLPAQLLLRTTLQMLTRHRMMTRSRPRPDARPVPGLWALVLVSLVSGCATADIDRLPQELGGLPTNAPARPVEGPAYPAVHDMPPPRAAALLDAEQQKRLEADLIAVRNRQPNQQKNIAKQKTKAEKEAKAKLAKENKPAGPRGKKVRKPRGEQAAGAAPAAAGAPPWPVPPQATGASPRP